MVHLSITFPTKKQLPRTGNSGKLRESSSSIYTTILAEVYDDYDDGIFSTQETI